MDKTSLFNFLQPLCINVAKNGDLSSVKHLDSYVDEILKKESNSSECVSSLNYLKEYIAFPLVLHLRNETFGKGRQNLLEAILCCLKKILCISHNIEWKFFIDVFTFIFKHLSAYDDPAKLGFINEECKSEAMFCIKSLCNALDSQYWEKMCEESFRPQLGHAIFICLQIVEKEKGRALRVAALETIQSIGLQNGKLLDVTTKNKFSLVFSNFLPGITIRTAKVATGEETQGHKVAVAALQCWEYFVILVLRDQFLLSYVQNLGISTTYINLRNKLYPINEKADILIAESPQTKFHDPLLNYDLKQENQTKLKFVTINSDWVTSTTNNLRILFKSIASLITHSHSAVRLTLIECAKNILFHCSRSLNKCLITCLEILVALSNDPEIDVRESATNALKHYDENLSEEDKERFSDLLEEQIFYLISRIPTFIKTQSDSKSLSSLRQIYGYLELIGSEGVLKFVTTPNHLHRLLRTLGVVFTYDISDSDILLEKISTEDSLEVMSVKPGLGSSFRYFQSRAIYDCASSCCHLIGSQPNLMLVVDHCLELAQESIAYRNEAYLILSLIMKGAGENKNIKLTEEEKEKIVGCIFDVIYNTLNLFDLPLSVSLPKSDLLEIDGSTNLLLPFKSSSLNISVDLAKQNVILVTNLLKIIGYSALLMQENFKVFLSNILCSVLEKAGDSNVLVSHSAALTLTCISTACKYSNISDLVEASVPLFWFNLSQKLKHLPDYPTAPLVLKFALKCNKKRIAPFIEDLVDDVLDSLDSFHSESSIPLLTVILAFVDALKTNFSDNQNNGVSEKNIDNSKLINEEKSLFQFICKLDKDTKALQNAQSLEREKDYIETEKLLKEEGLEECWQQKIKDDASESIEAEDVEPVKDIPRHIQCIVRILERCSYLLFIKERKTQLIILEIIRSSCFILNDWEDQKLPAFHKIWKPLVLRLKDRDFVVLLKALKVCVLMVKTSGTFLKRRCLQELFPSLIYFLQSQSHASLKQLPKSAYYLTPAFKAQKHILENFPGLIEGLEINTLETIDLLEVIILYLEDQQPRYLIDLALKILIKIKEIRPDLVWMTLSFLKGKFVIMPPSSLLPPVTIKGRKMKNLDCDVWKIYEDFS